MTADFNWFLNKQGPRGQQGVRGEQGFSPIITVAENTAKAYILRIQTQDDTFLTPNLRGTVDDLGGTYVRYNPETGQVYAGSPDIATTEAYGVVKMATPQDVTDAAQDVVVTPELLVNQINALDLPNNYVTTNTNQVINAAKNFTRNVEFTNTSNVTFRNGIKAPSIIEPYHGSTVISYEQDSSGNNRYIQVGGSQGKVVVRPSLKVVVDSVEYDVISAKDVATTDKTGIVKPDGSTVFIDENGVISAKSSEIDDANTSTQSTWSSSKIAGEISTVAREVVGIQGDVASLDADVSALKPVVESHTASIGAINDSVAMAMTDINGLKEGKQDKLTAGANITIEGNVISSTATGGAAIDDTNPSTTTVYSSSKVEELLSSYVPLSTYNELLARVEALENEINGGNA